MKDFVDLFREPFKLNYNGKYLFKTTFKGITSNILIITVALYAFWNIYTMKNPGAGLIMNNYQTIMSSNDKLYTLNSTNFYLPFQLISIKQGNHLDQNSNFQNISIFLQYILKEMIMFLIV